MLPRARKKDLVIEKIDDETLVYDLRTDRAHCLNKTASLVWRYCDGKTEIHEIARRLASRTGEPISEELVQFALQRLRKVRLLEEGQTVRRTPALTRREAIRTIGAVAGTLPLITSIVAPLAAQARSCIDPATCGQTRTDGVCCCVPVGNPLKKMQAKQRPV